MHKVYLWGILFLLASCNNDVLESERASELQAQDSSVFFKKSGMYPENTLNDYDFAGQLYYDFSESYLSGIHETAVADIVTRVESIADGDPDYLLLKPIGYTMLSASRLSFIYNNQILSNSDNIANATIGTVAKTSLTNFSSNVMLYQNQNKTYDELYLYIIGYESSVINNAAFTPIDKSVLLTTSSIVRYAFYFADRHKRKPRDRDWDMSVGVIAAGIEGSNESIAKAITMAVAESIVVNRNY